MFENRLRVVLVLPVLFGVLVVVRLYQLQVAKGDYYRERVDEALVAPRQYLPAVRGSIRDRTGRLLVSDEPALDVTVHYGLLSMNDSALLLLADRIRKRHPEFRSAPDEAVRAEAVRRIAGMWKT